MYGHRPLEAAFPFCAGFSARPHWRNTPARLSKCQRNAHWMRQQGKPAALTAGVNDMTDVTKEQVLDKLRGVRGPDMDGNIVDMGLVSDVFISDSKVYFSITVPAERARELDPLRAAAE